jgi:hypothetical protein
MHAYGALVTKLLRTYVMQTEALAKLRRRRTDGPRWACARLRGRTGNRRGCQTGGEGGESMKKRDKPMERTMHELLPLRLARQPGRAGTRCQKAAATAQPAVRSMFWGKVVSPTRWMAT